MFALNHHASSAFSLLTSSGSEQSDINTLVWSANIIHVNLWNVRVKVWCAYIYCVEITITQLLLTTPNVIVSLNLCHENRSTIWKGPLLWAPCFWVLPMAAPFVIVSQSYANTQCELFLGQRWHQIKQLHCWFEEDLDRCTVCLIKLIVLYCTPLYCIVLIHFYSASHGMSLSEALLTTPIEDFGSITRYVDLHVGLRQWRASWLKVFVTQRRFYAVNSKWVGLSVKLGVILGENIHTCL